MSHFFWAGTRSRRVGVERPWYGVSRRPRSGRQGNFGRTLGSSTIDPPFPRGAAVPLVALAGIGMAEIVGEHEVGNPWRDLGTEPRAVEHAVVPDPRLQPV